MKGKPRWWQISAILVLGFVLLGLVVLTSAYLALRSPSVQQRILASLKEPLAEAGVQVEVQSLSVDLFAGVNLEQLQLKLDKPPLVKADLGLARLRVGYSFWGLLRSKLEVSEILVEGLTGEVRLTLPDTPPPPEEPSAGLGPILELLRKPPVTLNGPSIALRNNRLHLVLDQGSKHIDADVKQLDMETSVSLQPGVLNLSSQMGLQVGIQLEQNDAKVGQLKLETQVALAPRFTVKVDAPKDSLTWMVNLSQLDLNVTGTKLHLVSPTRAVLDVSLAQLEWTPTLDLERQGPVEANPKPMDVIWPLTGQYAQKIALKDVQVNQKDGQHSLALTTQLRNSLAGKFQLPSLKVGAQQTWDIEKTLDILGLKFVQDGRVLADSESIRLHLHTDSEQGQGRANLEFDVSPLHSEMLKQTLASHMEFNLGFNLANPALRIVGSGLVNDEKLFTLNGEGQDDAGLLKGHLDLHLTPRPGLATLHAGLASLETLGWPQVDLQISHHTQHPMSLSEVNKDNWQQLTITNSLTLKIQQLRASPKNVVNFKDLLIRQELSLPARGVGAAASALDLSHHIDVKSLQHSALKKAIDVDQTLDLKAQVSERIDGTLAAKTQIDGFELARLNFSWQDKPREALLESQLDLFLEPRLQKLSDAAKSLDLIGGVNVQSRHKITLGHGAERLQDLKGLDLNRIKVDAHLNQSLTQTKVGADKRTISWAEPLRIDSRVQLNQGRAELLTRVTESQLTAKDQARVLGLQALVKASLSDLQTMARAEVKVMSDADGIELLKEIPDQDKLHKLLRNFKFVFHGILEHKDQLAIKTVFLGLHDQLLQFKGQGTFRLSGLGHFDGQLESQLSGVTDAPFRGSGRMQVPIKLVLYDKTKLSVDADPRFQGFSFETSDLQLKNLNGGIQIHEELSIDQAGRIGFLYLDTQNPFARVDYESLDPYVGERNLLSLDQLRFKHIVVGPFVENFAVRQNLILLNDLKMDLLNGSALGRFYLDLHPERLQLGFLGRFSGIQAELIKEPAKRIPAKDWAPLSGRMALNFDIRKRLATGRLDLTEIGQRQLLSLLDVLDPEYKDDQMIMARRALHVSYPEGLAVSMDQGLMDMNISLGGAISKDLSIRSIPLTGLINAKAGQALQNIETLLQSGGKK